MTRVKYILVAMLISCLACNNIKETTKGISPAVTGDKTIGPQNPDEFKNFIDSVITAELARENIPGAAFVFVKDGKIFYSKGYGMANIENNSRVDPAKTIFRIGSISKVFTADALLQLAGQNKLRLNEDVNAYLRSLKLPATFSKPVTVSHILTHTAGLDEIRPGTQAAEASGVLPLNEFLKNRILRLWAPGEIVMYSTYGITLGGLIIEEITGESFENYLSSGIWKPLQMFNTNITVPDIQQSNLAMGYESINGQNIPQPWEWYHTTPASSINSTVEDMANWIIAHLNRGKFGNATLMTGEKMDEMLKHQQGMNPGMYGMAYGFFEEYHNGLRFLHHGGNMAGFNSLVVLIPGKNAGFFFVSQHENSSVRDNLQWAILTKYYNDTSSLTIPPLPVKNAGRAKIFAGQYKLNIYCHSCNSQSRGLTFTVSANPDGSIQVNGKKWIEAEEKLLFIREDGKSRITFRQDGAGNITHMYFGGFWNFEKIQ